jgi:hypothetical protein
MSNNYRVLYHRVAAMNVKEVVYRLKNNIIARLKKRRTLPGDSFLTSEQFLSRQKRIHPTQAIHAQLAELVEEFRIQTTFPWQNIDAAASVSLFQAEFPLEKQSILDAATVYGQHCFQFFNQPIRFEDEIDWHYDPVMQQSVAAKYWTEIPYWHTDVVRGVKFVWELNRHQHFVTLAQAYYLSQDRRYAAELYRQWQHWLHSNPYPFGINWCSSLEAGLRLISWTWALQFAKMSSYLTPLFYSHLLQSIEQHAEYIADHLSLHSSANNHLLGETLGLIYAGSYFGHLVNAPQWRAKGFAVFYQEFFRQVHEDGVIREQTTHYQLYVFYYALLALQAAEWLGQPVPPGFRERLEKMAEFISAILDESGELPSIGDDDGGQALWLASHSVPPAKRLLSTAAVFFNRSDFKNQSRSLHPETFWLLGASCVTTWHDLPSQKNSKELFYFSEGGYAVVHRTLNDLDHRLIFDAGPLGLDRMASHGHADALNVILSVAGQPVLIDSGTFTYRGEPGWRDYFRSTHAHNTIVIDGKNQSKIVGPFQWGRRATACFTHLGGDEQPLSIIAKHNGYRKLGVVHQRQVRQEGRCWIISDSILGKVKREVVLLWHLAPGEAKMHSPEHLRLTLANLRVDIKIKASVPFFCQIKNGVTNPIQGWYSPGFGLKKSNPVFCITTFHPFPVEIVTQIEIGLK